jgi:isoleucyl-tRNA synthetase
MPFFTEYLYQRLLVDTGLSAASESVHFTRFPEPDRALLDLELEARMQAARDVVGLGLVIREREKIGVRRPLARITVASADPVVHAALSQFEDAILGELNVRAVELRSDDASLSKITAKPNFRTLGKRLGPKLKAVQTRLGTFNADDLAEFERAGSFVVEGETLTREDILITREASGEGALESGRGITVMLDTRITAELHAEGLARELVNRIQNLRKQAGLEVSQRIRLVLACDGVLGEVADSETLSELIARETLAVELTRVRENVAPKLAHVKSDSIEKERVTIALEAV